MAPLPSVSALAPAALAAMPGARQLGHRQRGQRFLERNVDHRARCSGQRRVHARTRGGDPADEGGLLADRTDRRLRQVIHLPGQQMGDAAGEKQRQVRRRIVAAGHQTEGRNIDERRRRVASAQRIGIALPVAKLARPALANDQIDGPNGTRGACPRRDAFAVVQIPR